MSIMKKTLSLAGAALLSLSLAAPASAAVTTTRPPEGGVWSHGINGSGIVVSDYYHATKWHHSTAVGKTTKRSVAAPGKTSVARARKALMNNQAYYGLGK